MSKHRKCEFPQDYYIKNYDPYKHTPAQNARYYSSIGASRSNSGYYYLIGYDQYGYGFYIEGMPLMGHTEDIEEFVSNKTNYTPYGKRIDYTVYRYALSQDAKVFLEYMEANPQAEKMLERCNARAKKRKAREQSFRYFVSDVKEAMKPVVLILVIVGVIALIHHVRNSKKSDFDSEAYNASRMYSGSGYTNTQSDSSDDNWHDAGKQFDLSPGMTIKYNDDVLFHDFGSYATKGFDLASNSVASGAGDFGFMISINNPDSASIAYYNNTNDDIVPLETIIEFPGGDISYFYEELEYWDHVVSGYSSCSDGFGFVKVNYSNGIVLGLGIYKQGDELYAFNLTRTN